MKGFVPLDHGGRFSSSSRLSPLAPPFKLDTSFPRPVPHALGNIPESHGCESYFNDDPSSVFAARLPHDSWLQINSPNFVPNLYPNSDPSLSLSLGTSPVLPVCTAPASANGQSTTDFFSSESVGRPYHLQHSSASVQCSSAPFTADGHDDMLLESGLGPTARVGGLWSQKNGGEQWEMPFPANYAGQVSQGISTTNGFPGGDKPSKVWVGKSGGSLAGKPYAGPQCTNVSVRKLSSESDEKFGGVQFSTSRTSISNPVSHQERPYQCATSSNLSMETWSQINPTIASCGNHFKGFDPYRPDPLCYYPAASNHYETQSIVDNYTGSINKTMPSNINPIEPPKDACNMKETFERRSSSITFCIPANAERSDVTSNINGLVEKNKDPFVDPSMLINVSPRHLTHSVDPKSKLQVTDTLVTGETMEDSSFHCSSEELEQFNHGVDSPCWKGASDSRYSLFGAAEGGGNNFSIQGTQYLPVNSNSAVDFSSSERQKNGNHFGENGPFSFVKQSSPVVSSSRDICPNILDEGSNGVSNDSQLSNENLVHHLVPGNADSGSCAKPSSDQQLSNENLVHCLVPGSPNSGSGVKPSQTNKFSHHKGNTDTDMKQHSGEGGTADPGISFEDVAHFGTTQFPYHVGDHYSSLLSRENVRIENSLTESIAESFDTFTGGNSSANVQQLVHSMHLVSKVLLYCSEDEYALKEHDYSVIQQIVQNLETCLSRSGKMNSMPKTRSPQPETTNCSGKPIETHKGTVVGLSEATNTKVQDVQSRCYTQNGCEDNKNSSIGMKEVGSPLPALPCNDLDKKDDSTKRIRIILEENFHEEESDMQFYKSLWLEAEAELCSQKYKERFARMKLERENYKKHVAYELSDADKPPRSKVIFEGNRDPVAESRSEVTVDREIPKVPIQNDSCHTEDDASVMARFHILKSRINRIPVDEESQPHDSINGASHLGIEKILSSPSSGNGEDNEMKQQQHTVVEKRKNPGFFMDSEAKYFSERQNSMEFGAMQSAITNILLERRSAGGSDSASTEWEHVLREATWPGVA